MNLDNKISHLIFDIDPRLKKNSLHASEGKLTNYQLHTLLFLQEKKQASLNEIAKIFGSSLPPATISINKLVKYGFVKRKNQHQIAVSL